MHPKSGASFLTIFTMVGKPQDLAHKAWIEHLRLTGSCVGRCGYSGEWDTVLALKELTVCGVGQVLQPTSSFYRWSSGEDLRPRYKGYGEGCRTPFGRGASQVQASWGDKSAHV